MSTSGLEVFDKTLQTTHIWLDEMGQTLGPDRGRSYHALMAVLHALRDMLPINETAHLSAQLPMLVRGMYFHEWNPGHATQSRTRSLEEFLTHIQNHLQHMRPMGADDACRAVFSVLDHHVGAAELDKIKQILPEEIRHFWRSMTGALPPGRERAAKTESRY